MKKIAILLLAIISASAIYGQDKKVAVFDPAGSVSSSIKEIVREEISTVVVNALGYTVLERSLINKVLEENKFQKGGLVDDSQISDVGKRMGANLVLVSSLTIMEDGNYYISCKMIDVLTARIEKQKTARTHQKANDLIDVVGKMVNEMFLGTTRVAENPSQEKTFKQEVKQENKPNQNERNITNSNIRQQTNGIFVFEDLGLMVMNRGLGSASWQYAKNKCIESEKGGFTNWYLPSKDELVMIFETKDENFKKGLDSFWYWSSTEISDKKAYNVSRNAWATDETKKNDGPDCLCVRKLR